MSEGSRPPPPPAPLQNWSSLNFHCKVNPGQTKKTVGPSPWKMFFWIHAKAGTLSSLNVYFGLFYYVYLRYLDFQTVGGGGVQISEPSALVDLCMLIYQKWQLGRGV